MIFGNSGVGGPGNFIFTALVACVAAAWLLHPAGVHLENYKYTPFAVNAAFRLWSPDGKMTAYQGKADDEYDLFLRTLDSPGPRQLTHAPGEAVPLGWLPDSSHILYLLHTSRQAPN